MKREGRRGGEGRGEERRGGWEKEIGVQLCEGPAASAGIQAAQEKGSGSGGLRAPGPLRGG